MLRSGHGLEFNLIVLVASKLPFPLYQWVITKWFKSWYQRHMSTEAKYRKAAWNYWRSCSLPQKFWVALEWVWRRYGHDQGWDEEYPITQWWATWLGITLFSYSGERRYVSLTAGKYHYAYYFKPLWE